MKDEIKEILQEVIDDIWQMNEYTYQAKKLEKVLDYITNLQEENEKLKELCDKYEEEHSTAFNLWKTNIIENVPTLSDMQEQLEDYKSRNKKAIEYIKQYREVYYPDEPLSEPIIQYGLGIYEEDFDEEKILNILQGEDKDDTNSR